jgi:hypothetical protein
MAGYVSECETSPAVAVYCGAQYFCLGLKHNKLDDIDLINWK